MLPKTRTVLYATDLGRQAPRVFQHAVALARGHKARIVLLHVLEPLSATASALVRNVVPAETLSAIEKSGYADIRAEIERRLEAFCEDELAGTADIKSVVSDIRIVVGNPASSILEEAARAKADVIVMGMHGRTGIERLMLGSVANKVAHRSTVPVLLVPVEPAQ